jgi:hypothetical protein
MEDCTLVDASDLSRLMARHAFNRLYSATYMQALGPVKAAVIESSNLIQGDALCSHCARRNSLAFIRSEDVTVCMQCVELLSLLLVPPDIAGGHALSRVNAHWLTGDEVADVMATRTDHGPYEYKSKLGVFSCDNCHTPNLPCRLTDEKEKDLCFACARIWLKRQAGKAAMTPMEPEPKTATALRHMATKLEVRAARLNTVFLDVQEQAEEVHCAEVNPSYGRRTLYITEEQKAELAIGASNMTVEARISVAKVNAVRTETLEKVAVVKAAWVEAIAARMPKAMELRKTLVEAEAGAVARRKAFKRAIMQQAVAGRVAMRDATLESRTEAAAEAVRAAVQAESALAYAVADVREAEAALVAIEDEDDET